MQYWHFEHKCRLCQADVPGIHLQIQVFLSEACQFCILRKLASVNKPHEECFVDSQTEGQLYGHNYLLHHYFFSRFIITVEAPRTSQSSEWNWMHHGTVAPQLQDARVELRGLPVSWEGWWWSHSRTPCISQFNRHNLCSIRCMCVQYHTGHPCHIKLNCCYIISCNNENCWARWY